VKALKPVPPLSSTPAARALEPPGAGIFEADAGNRDGAAMFALNGTPPPAEGNQGRSAKFRKK